MRLKSWIAILFLVVFLASCQKEVPLPSLTPTRTLVPSQTPLPPTATNTPYPTETPSARPATNTLSVTQTQTWPETPTSTPTITPTPTVTLTNIPSPTITGTPPTVTLTPTPTISTTPTVSPTPTGTAPTSPLVWVNPASVSVNHVGETGQVNIQLTNFTGVFRMNLLVSFDPEIVQVVDAMSSENGVQVAPGNCPVPDFIDVNSVDNEEGTIDYQVEAISACNGGAAVIIEFKCIASGASAISLDDTFVTDINDDEIEHTHDDGAITCQP